MENGKHTKQRVRWHSRRGMLELDLILVPFCEQHFEQLDAVLQAHYVALLQCEDQDLLSWLLGHAAPADPGLAAIVQLIRECHGSAAAAPPLP